MVMSKKWLAMLLCGLMVLVASTVSAASTKLVDVPADHWAYDAVAQLDIDGFIMPSSDNTFKGDGNVTRYDLAYMVGTYLQKKGHSPANATFSDVPANHPAKNAIAYCESVLSGYGDGTFRGDKEMNRLEIALVLSTLLGDKAIGEVSFKDVPADHRAYNAVKTVASNHIMSGYGDNTFRGDNKMTRYELALTFAKFLATNS